MKVLATTPVRPKGTLTAPQEAVHAVHAVPVMHVAPPRRTRVRAGNYVPPRAPVMRPGADHRHLHSRGIRC